MSLTNPTAYSLLLALAGRVPAGFTPGLDRLLVEEADLPAQVRGIATFVAVPTADQVRTLEELGLTVDPMKYVALAEVTGPVRAMEAAVRCGIATDVHLDERVQSPKPSPRVQRPAEEHRRQRSPHVPLAS